MVLGCPLLSFSFFSQNKTCFVVASDIPIYDLQYIGRIVYFGGHLVTTIYCSIYWHGFNQGLKVGVSVAALLEVLGIFGSLGTRAEVRWGDLEESCLD